jgi:serine protease inhibitor
MKRYAIGLLLLAGLAAIGSAEPASRFQRFTLAKDNTRLALSLYDQLRKQEGNLFCSPFSLSTALGMTYAGARGQTAKEMNKVLKYSLDDEDVHNSFAGLLKEINGNADDKTAGYKLTTANALWGQKNYGFLPEYIKLTKDNYGSGLQEVDYKSAPAEARKTINAWVEKQTNNTIKDLVPEGLLTPNTRLVLTNAIYFKGAWEKQFKKDRTKDDTFHVDEAKDVKAAFMHQTDKFGYYSNPTFQMLELPYVGEDVTMVILLPREITGLPVLEKSINVESLVDWFSRMRNVEVQVNIPKFKLASEFRLKKELSALGLGRAFSDEADFSGMNGGKEPLHIDDVVHKAFIDVNEEGTEAGAASGVGVGTKGGDQVAPKVPVFEADHPFLFMIRDNRSDSILFLGRVVNPEK